MKALLLYIAIVNIIALLVMRIDKYKAQRHQWRISEASIFLVGLLGGGFGVLLGMNIFHHKTKHLKFTIGIPVVIALNIISFWYFLQMLRLYVS